MAALDGPPVLGRPLLVAPFLGSATPLLVVTSQRVRLL